MRKWGTSAQRGDQRDARHQSRAPFSSPTPWLPDRQLALMISQASCFGEMAHGPYLASVTPHPTLPQKCGWDYETGYLPSGACSWACTLGFYPPPEDVGGVSAVACLPCTNAPLGAVYTGPGDAGSAGGCPWQCGPGYYRDGVGCTSCMTGTYSLVTGAALPVL